MDARATIPPVFDRPQLGRDHPWLGAIVEAIDKRLRNRDGVGEFSTSPGCILRIRVVESRDGLAFSDGARVHPGDRIVDLHLWNEQLPSMPKHGATLAWARRINRAFDMSLRELARHLAGRRDLDDVVAIRANMSFGLPERGNQIARFAARYGFEPVASARSRSLDETLHRFGENILISLMIIARHAVVFRAGTLRRGRVPVYMSRRTLQSRFGARRELPAFLQRSWLEDVRASSDVALPDARIRENRP